MAGGKYDDTKAFSGKKVAIWALSLFLIISIVGTLGTYLFGEWLTPILMKKNKAETERAAIERVRQREGTTHVR